MFEFATMNRDEFDKLQSLYDEIIELTCITKESNSRDISLSYYPKLTPIVTECLEFSPYSHFYTQVLIDIIVKTYNTNIYRSDLLVKANIDAKYDNPSYYPNSTLVEIEEDEYFLNGLLLTWSKPVGNISEKIKIKYKKFFKATRDLLIYDLIRKKCDLKRRLEVISEYSNNSLVRSLSSAEKIFLYETKGIFNSHYLNLNPAHAIFLDAKFKTKYICENDLNQEEKDMQVDQLAKIIKERHIAAKEVYEINNAEDQIKFEIFKVIQNGYTISKCQNCGKLFIPITNSKNPNQKARNDQKYCNNIYSFTGKTCKEIGALNQRKEKIKESAILTEYQREYKRMYGLHYNHPKTFNENKFKQWSKKSKKLLEKYSYEEIEAFKQELKNLSDSIFKV